MLLYRRRRAGQVDAASGGDGSGVGAMAHKGDSDRRKKGGRGGKVGRSWAGSGERERRGRWVAPLSGFFLLLLLFFFQGIKERKKRGKNKNKAKVLFFPKYFIT